ncbi:hypothetical protein DXU92_06950 [Brachybacterium saurashtrense]|uniref:Uncharacterized protein n=1 Tax=Brachybacterium saurashtrense TaxID=556288 RepID=A0A345YKM9_9MICO|nr:hypothetical protein DWV08_01820 [Brachybacterium saurashtrense]RRR23093.1 hypothetical protein DXU92_06950 [Brachybacterium saurashtrense]
MTAWRHPDGVVVSRDPGYAPMPVLLLLVPALAAMALTALLPRGRGAAELGVRRGSALRAETAVLLGLVLAFPLLVPLLPTGEDYVLVKAALFLLVPSVVLALSARRRGASLMIRRPEVGSAVIALPALVLGVLSTVGPFSSGAPRAGRPSRSC